LSAALVVAQSLLAGAEADEKQKVDITLQRIRTPLQ